MFEGFDEEDVLLPADGFGIPDHDASLRGGDDAAEIRQEVDARHPRPRLLRHRHLAQKLVLRKELGGEEIFFFTIHVYRR